MARSRWPDAQIEVAVAKWDLGKEQQREKREKRREKREERWFGPRRAGWWRKGSGPRRDEGRAQREARRERQAQSR